MVVASNSSGMLGRIMKKQVTIVNGINYANMRILENGDPDPYNMMVHHYIGHRSMSCQALKPNTCRP